MEQSLFESAIHTWLLLMIISRAESDSQSLSPQKYEKESTGKIRSTWNSESEKKTQRDRHRMFWGSSRNIFNMNQVFCWFQFLSRIVKKTKLNAGWTLPQCYLSLVLLFCLFWPLIKKSFFFVDNLKTF